MRSFLRVAWNVSQQALSKQSPVLPIETSIPALTQRLVNSTAVAALVGVVNQAGVGATTVKRHLER